MPDLNTNTRNAPDWLLDLVSSVAKRYRLQSPITQSHLSASPMWFSPDKMDEISSQEEE